MRFLKQFFYGILLIAIFAALAWGFYVIFLKPSPTCSDGIQNGNEIGVDCGGRCDRECLPSDIREVSVRGNIQVLPIATSSGATVLLQVQNLNSDYAAEFDYTLSMKNSSGKEVMSSNGENFIYSGEIKYLIFPNLSFLEDPKTLKPEFKITQTNWIKEEDMRKPSIFVQNANTNIFSDKIEVVGRFTNGDAGTLDKAYVVAILYDNRGNVIGASQTEAENIEPSETRNFVVIHPFVSSINSSRTQVFVYPYRD